MLESTTKANGREGTMFQVKLGAVQTRYGHEVRCYDGPTSAMTCWHSSLSDARCCARSACKAGRGTSLKIIVSTKAR